MNGNHPPPDERLQGVELPVTPQHQRVEAEVGDGSLSFPINLVNDIFPTPAQALAPSMRRGRGRPRGSKIKKTIATENAFRRPQTRFPSPPQAVGDERDSHQSWMGDEYIPSNYGDSPYRAADTPQLGSEDTLISPDTCESQAAAEFTKSYRKSLHLTREKNRQSVTISKERMKEEEQYALAKLIDSRTWSQN
ncbi:hypothetical protein F52700_6327 [Fusarium sp. NRRL 52700]|nr:hypothetical protein F52700_6327 [Fusarium sp. NRRL 52700]